jgi:mitochondrial fission protein ELM1
MRPSVIPLDAFSLAVLPLHDVSSNPPENVIALSTSPNECREELIAEEKKIFASENGLDMDIPFWGIFIGGESKARKFPSESVLKILRHILDESVRRNHQCLITTSRRTPPEFEEKLASLRTAYHNQIAFLQIYSNNPKSTTKGILGLSSHVFITEDSVSMVSESLWAMRKTFLVELPSSKNTADKINRFKNNLIEKKLIGAIKSDMGSEDISEAIDFNPDFESFTDINLVRDAVNRLIPV